MRAWNRFPQRSVEEFRESCSAYQYLRDFDSRAEQRTLRLRIHHMAEQYAVFNVQTNRRAR